MPTIVCPNPACRQHVVVPEDMPGQTITCPHCTTEIVIPGGRDSTVSDGIDKGVRFAHYEIIELIGKGGMGEVYKAKNLRLNKTVALKVLSDVLAGHDQAFVQRFLREAQSGARLEHPNVVPIFFVGAADDQYFIEMQYVEGQTLGDLIRDDSRPDVAQATRIILEATKGVAAAHETGIIHRDLKPENIMIDTKGNVKVTDFGLAKLEEDPTTVTLSGHIMGTPNYMSPEQCEGKPADVRSDVYALGATYFHAATGQPPYTSETLVGLIHHHTSSPVPNPRERNPEISPRIASIIRKAMAKRPEDRYPSCEKMIVDLENALENQETLLAPREVRLPKMLPKAVGSTPAPRPKLITVQPKRQLPWAIDIVVLLLVAASLVGLVYAGLRLYENWEADSAGTGAKKRPSLLPKLPSLPGRRPDIQVVTEQPSEWQDVFDRKNLHGWRIESGVWKVENGTLVCTGQGGQVKRLTADRTWQGSAFLLEYTAKGTGALGAWVEANGREVLLCWGGEHGDSAHLRANGTDGERTSIRIDPARSYRVRIELDGEWARYTIDHHRTGPEPLRLSSSGNTFRVGLATDGEGAQYESVRVKVLTARTSE